MGNHYVPQKYLKGFAVPGTDKLWVYDKEKHDFWPFPTNVLKIAQENNFYEGEAEVKLNETVESPANPVIDKIRNRQPIDEVERARLAIYIAAMLVRVPHKRLRERAMVPEVIEGVVQRFMERIRNIAATTDINPEIVASRRREVESAHEKLLINTPDEILKQIRSPWPSEQLVNLVYSMTWRYLDAGDGPLFFLSTDNPAFYFSAYGLGRAESELCFPVSSEICLLGNRRLTADAEKVLIVRQKAVKEMNRRNASGATRFLFYRERAPWIEKIAHKEKPYTSRILWSTA